MVVVAALGRFFRRVGACYLEQPSWASSCIDSSLCESGFMMPISARGGAYPRSPFPRPHCAGVRSGVQSGVRRRLDLLVCRSWRLGASRCCVPRGHCLNVGPSRVLLVRVRGSRADEGPSLASQFQCLGVDEILKVLLPLATLGACLAIQRALRSFCSCALGNLLGAFCLLLFLRWPS